MNIKYEAINEIHFERLESLLNEAAVSKNPFSGKKNLMAQLKKEEDYFKGFVAIDAEGEIVGYVLFSFAYYIWTGKAIYMNKFYVRPDIRKRGIETQLLHRVITYAKQNDYQLIRWDISNKSETMIRFYESLGAKVDNVQLNCELALTR